MQLNPGPLPYAPEWPKPDRLGFVLEWAPKLCTPQKNLGEFIMSITMYRASVPVFIRALGNLKAVLQKGEAHAEAKKFKPEVLLNDRLCADMLPLIKQVQIATDMSKGCAARLAGVEVTKFEDNEASFADLYARIDK